ncbi:MAG: thioredoxin domain-containing protein [Thermodesulfobacteriota bacterium]
MRGKSRIIIAGVLVLIAVAALFLFYNKNGDAAVLATVNGQAITVDRFHREVDRLEEPHRGMFKEDPAQFLDLMIIRTLLLQEAGVQGLEKGGEEEDDAIRRFLEKRFSTPPEVSKEEVLNFYEAFKGNTIDMPFEQAEPMIEQMIRKAKQEEEYTQFLEEIRSSADIEINADRVQAIAARPSGSTDGTNTREEFDTALKSGKPVLVDFGSNSCLPCRKLRPILDEIKKEKGGQVEVLVIDVNKHQGLSREYKVRVIPTLVFFDAGGKEVFRTQGFMSKAALLEHLAKVGVV